MWLSVKATCKQIMLAIFLKTVCSTVAEAMKLITNPSDGDKRKLREFIENVEVVFEPASLRYLHLDEGIFCRVRRLAWCNDPES